LRCHASLYRNARSLCGAPVVEELLRETYSRASAAKRGPSANADEVRSWMFTILRNVWLNGRRRIWRPRESSFRGRRQCRFHRMRSAAFLSFGRIHLRPAPDQNLGPLPRRVRPKVWKRVRRPGKWRSSNGFVGLIAITSSLPDAHPEARTGIMESASDDPRSQFLPVRPGLGQRGHFLEMSG